MSAATTAEAAEIASALGGACRSGRWSRCRCPVHDSRGPTLALRDGERGLIAVCHAGCDRADIIATLRERGLLGGSDRCRRDLVTVHRGGDVDDAARRTAMAQRIWDAARDTGRSPVASYLASRGITIPLPPSLRWAPRCPHPSAIYLPAMVARVENVDGELIGVHRTFLRLDGSGKAGVEPQKAMLGRAIGGAVRLASAAETLMIAEGVETTLAAMEATGRPAWAALSTSGMMALRLPAMVRTIIILADHDRNGAGERAARAAAQRWLAEGRRVLIALPPEPGSDFADLLGGGAEMHDAVA